MDDISVEEFAQLLASKKEIQILDVREFLEFHTYNIGGINIQSRRSNYCGLPTRCKKQNS
jgi:rhodanese-related sulfurtransferase